MSQGWSLMDEPGLVIADQGFHTAGWWAGNLVETC